MLVANNVNSFSLLLSLVIDAFFRGAFFTGANFPDLNLRGASFTEGLLTRVLNLRINYKLKFIVKGGENKLNSILNHAF